MLRPPPAGSIKNPYSRRMLQQLIAAKGEVVRYETLAIALGLSVADADWLRSLHVIQQTKSRLADVSWVKMFGRVKTVSGVGYYFEHRGFEDGEGDTEERSGP